MSNSISLSLEDMIKKSFKNEKGKWVGVKHAFPIFLQEYLYKIFPDDIDFIPFVRYTLTLELKAGRDGNISEGKTSNTDILIENISSGNKIIVEESEIRTFFENSMKRFHIFPISMIRKALIDDIMFIDGHAIVAIYDSKFNEIEIFDSNPENKLEAKVTNYKQVINRFFYKIYKSPNIYYSTDYVYHSLSYYATDTSNKYLYSSDGFCVIWCLWYINFRIKHKNLSGKQAIKAINKWFYKQRDKSDNAKTIIRGYAQFVEKIIKNYTNPPENYKQNKNRRFY